MGSLCFTNDGQRLSLLFGDAGANLTRGGEVLDHALQEDDRHDCLIVVLEGEVI